MDVTEKTLAAVRAMFDEVANRGKLDVMPHADELLRTIQNPEATKQSRDSAAQAIHALLSNSQKKEEVLYEAMHTLLAIAGEISNNLRETQTALDEARAKLKGM